ncbi:MAG: type II/IV secretion system protein [Planctomycetota bacterium]|nr:MAG: type II/IV secretion system protein [Planctomycetota bacterium]
MPKQRKTLGQILLEKKLITLQQLEEALEKQKNTSPHLPLGEILISLGYATPHAILWALAEQYQISHIHNIERQLQPEIAKLLPRDFCLKHKVIALEKFDDELHIVLSDPEKMDRVRQLQNVYKDLAKYNFTFSLTYQKDIEKCLTLVWGRNRSSFESAIWNLSQLEEDQLSEILLVKILDECIREEVECVFLDLFAQSCCIYSKLSYRKRKLAEVDRDRGEHILRKLEEQVEVGGIVQHTKGGKKFRLFLQKQEADSFLHITLTKLFFPKSYSTLLQKLDPLPLSRSSQGIFLFVGFPCSIQSFLLYLLHQLFLPCSSRVAILALASQYPSDRFFHFPPPRPPLSLCQLDPDCVLIDTPEAKRNLSYSVRLAEEGRCVLANTHVWTGYELWQFSPRFVSVFYRFCQGIVEVWRFRYLCPHCKAEMDSSAVPAHWRKLQIPQFFLPRGCAQCYHSGYKAEEICVEVFYPQENLEPDSPLSWEDFVQYSRMYQQTIEQLRSGSISLYDVQPIIFPARGRVNRGKG